MIGITQETKDEILGFIKEKTGAAAVDIICVTSTIPCEQQKNGKGCLTDHLSEEFGYGIEQKYLQGFHMQAAGMDVFGEPMDDDE